MLLLVLISEEWIGSYFYLQRGRIRSLTLPCIAVTLSKVHTLRFISIYKTGFVAPVCALVRLNLYDFVNQSGRAVPFPTDLQIYLNLPSTAILLLSILESKIKLIFQSANFCWCKIAEQSSPKEVSCSLCNTMDGHVG